MDRLDGDLAALAAAPAPAGLARLDAALALQLGTDADGLGWPQRGALAAVSLVLGLAMGAADPPRPPAAADGVSLSPGTNLLPSTLLLAGGQ